MIADVPRAFVAGKEQEERLIHRAGVTESQEASVRAGVTDERLVW